MQVDLSESEIRLLTEKSYSLGLYGLKMKLEQVLANAIGPAERASIDMNDRVQTYLEKHPNERFADVLNRFSREDAERGQRLGA